MPIDAAHFEAESAPYPELATDRAPAAAELAAIRAEMAKHGLSDDGAIQVILRAPSVPAVATPRTHADPGGRSGSPGR